ncbi:MAG: toll/interleukin-1 receptor domain-containing protein [Anaerolineales bacterium]|jgi:hypothetical protein
MTHDVFVSYSSKDKSITDSIVATMEQNNIRCWYAPRDIKPSEDWGSAISKAIEESKIFLIIFSGNANHSRRVLDETNLAIAQELTILPFRIEKLEPDGAMRLHLSSRHWLDAYDPSWQSHIKKLINTISSYLETTIPEEEVQVPEILTQKQKPPRNDRLRNTLFGIAAAVFVIAVAFIVVVSLNNGDGDSQASSPPPTEQVATPTQDFLSVTQTYVASANDQGKPTPQATFTTEPVVEQPEFSLTGPSDWGHYTTNEISLWMPPNWQGGDPSADLPAMLDAIEEANPDFAQYAAAIRANPDAFLYWGYDLNSTASFLTNMNIVTERVPSSITVNQYIDLLSQQLPAMYEIVSTDIYSKNGYQVGELVSQVEMGGAQVGQIMFILRGDNAVYALTFSTQLNEFNQRVETFRQIFEYFEIAPGY